MAREIDIARAPDGTNWRKLARCTTDKTCPDFFTSDTQERYTCRAVCFTCPVRWDCLSDALARPELVGIWGGVDEYEIRRALSVDSKGEPKERAHKPRCPYCKSRDLTTGVKTRRGTPVECKDCRLSWIIPLLKRPRKTPEGEAALVHPNLVAEGCNDDMDDGLQAGHESAHP